MAWLRTNGLWLGWGFHFAWNASMGILFGLPISGITDFASIVQTRAFGRLSLTGGDDHGPEGAAFTAIVLLVGTAVLARITRDYAWNDTYVPIVAAGYPMDAPPPAAHVAMEQQAKARRRGISGSNSSDRPPSTRSARRRAKALIVRNENKVKENDKNKNPTKVACFLPRAAGKVSCNTPSLTSNSPQLRHKNTAFFD